MLCGLSAFGNVVRSLQ